MLPPREQPGRTETAASAGSPSLSSATGTPGDDRDALWAALSLQPFAPAAGIAWLTLLSQRISNLRTAAVFLRNPDGEPGLLAGWPQDAPVGDEMTDSAREGIERAVPLALSSMRGFHLVCPIAAGSGAVAVAEVTPLAVPALQAALDELQWGTGWLEAALSREAGAAALARADRLELAARLCEDIARASDAVSAASVLAAGIGAAFGATAVTVGLQRRRELAIVSRAPVPSLRLRPDHELLAAMASAIDSQRAWTLPAFSPLPGMTDAAGPAASVDAERQSIAGSAADATSRSEAGSGPAGETTPRATAAFAIPLLALDVAAGAIVVERPLDTGFDPDVVASLEAIALQAAPLIHAKPMSRPTQVTPGRRLFVALFGPVRLRLKLLMVALLAAALVVIGATGSYSVPVSGIVEGAPYRVVTAPFAGPLAEVPVRRGDPVTRGQILAVLDDAGLQAERLRLTAEREQLLAELKEAKNNRDSSPPEDIDVRLKEIQIRQRTIEDRIGRARVISPVDGVVVGGVGLGAAGNTVPQGEALFEVAPVDSYRLVLWVDRREASQVREGQSGSLRMAPGNQEVAFTVRRLTAVSARVAGQARVRIEAQPQGFLGAAIEPGTEGTGAIDVGKRKQVWIWWREAQREWGEL